MVGKFHGETCPVCGAGTLQDGARTRTITRGPYQFISNVTGAYCDTCDDGIIYHDEEEEKKWESFLEETGGRYQKHVVT